jgi:hypothetical protein
VTLDVEPGVETTKPASERGEPVPGRTTNIAGATRTALGQQPARLFVVLAGLVVLAFAAVVRPVDVASTEGPRDCGPLAFAFGGVDDLHTSLCREAFAPRAAAGALLLLTLGGLAVALAANVQYWRGYTLGRVWSDTRRWRELVIGTTAVVTAVIVLAAALSTRAASVEFVAAQRAPLARPSTQTTAGFTTETTLLEGADFDSTAEIVATIPPVARPSPTSPPTSDAPTTVNGGTPPSAPTPLVVTATAWFGASPTPVDSVSIPEGSLPVGAANGADDKHAFLRLTGTDAALVLGEHTSPAATRSADAASIQACPVTTESWEPQDGGTFDDEPEFSTTGCVPLVRQSNGTWVADLSGFDDRGGRRGFALVPADPEGSWQVTLTAPGTPE